MNIQFPQIPEEPLFSEIGLVQVSKDLFNCPTFCHADLKEAIATASAYGYMPPRMNRSTSKGDALTRQAMIQHWAVGPLKKGYRLFTIGTPMPNGKVDFHFVKVTKHPPKDGYLDMTLVKQVYQTFKDNWPDYMANFKASLQPGVKINPPAKYDPKWLNPEQSVLAVKNQLPYNKIQTVELDDGHYYLLGKYMRLSQAAQYLGVEYIPIYIELGSHPFQWPNVDIPTLLKWRAAAMPYQTYDLVRQYPAYIQIPNSLWVKAKIREFAPITPWTIYPEWQHESTTLL